MSRALSLFFFYVSMDIQHRKFSSGKSSHTLTQFPEVKGWSTRIKVSRVTVPNILLNPRLVFTIAPGHSFALILHVYPTIQEISSVHHCESKFRAGSVDHSIVHYIISLFTFFCLFFVCLVVFHFLCVYYLLRSWRCLPCRYLFDKPFGICM